MDPLGLGLKVVRFTLGLPLLKIQVLIMRYFGDNLKSIAEVITQRYKLEHTYLQKENSP